MCCKCMNLICICKRQKINCNKKQIILYVLHSSSYNINYTHKDITLAIIARGISQYNHLSRRSIASQAGAGRNPSDTGRRPVKSNHLCSLFLSFSPVTYISNKMPLNIFDISFSCNVHTRSSSLLGTSSDLPRRKDIGLPPHRDQY